MHLCHSSFACSWQLKTTTGGGAPSCVVVLPESLCTATASTTTAAAPTCQDSCRYGVLRFCCHRVFVDVSGFMQADVRIHLVGRLCLV